MGDTKKKWSDRLAVGVVLLISVFRIALLMRTPISAYTDQAYDDELLFQYALNLISGNWLGSFHSLTLVKGISYPVYLALLYKAGIPYLMGLGLLIFVSAAAFCLAIHRYVKNKWTLRILYVFLIFNPITFQTYSTMRVYRIAIMPEISLLLFSLAIGAYLRLDDGVRKYGVWLLAEAFVYPFFYYIREDSIWVLPFLTVLAILETGILVSKGIKNHIRWKKIVLEIFLCCLPFAMLEVSSGLLKCINHHYYGVYEVNDRTEGPFAHVLSKLYSIEDAYKDNDDIVYCSRDALDLAYAASPALNSISSQINASVMQWGAGAECKGDIIAWALRSGADQAGCYQDAATEYAFWSKVDQELDEAFQDGRLMKKSGITISSQLPPISASRLKTQVEKSLQLSWKVNTYQNLSAYAGVGTGDPQEIRTYEVITGANAIYSDGDSNYLYSQRYITCGRKIMKIFQTAGPLFTILAAIGYIFMIIEVILQRILEKKWSYQRIQMWLINTGVMLSIWVLCFGVSFEYVYVFTQPKEVQTTVFIFYASGAYMLSAAAQYINVYMGGRDMLNCIKKLYRRNK